MSYETTMAQAAARAAESAARLHKTHCSVCAIRGAKPCSEGRHLGNTARAARATARKEKAKDGQATPGQGELDLGI